MNGVRRGALAVLLVIGTACGGSNGGRPHSTGTSPPLSDATTTAAAPPAGSGSATTVWLCRPGQPGDPCAFPNASTVVSASGTRTIENRPDDPTSRFDCFYVYPTVSTEPTDNSDLVVHREETDVAVLQASQFSQVCRVWAPMYRQRTAASLSKGLGADPQADTVAYQSLLSAWNDYLAHDNDGRPVIFIGHSQGAAMLIRLIAGQVDPDPARRDATVLAVLAGGNVTVPTGATVGATFSHLPICTTPAEASCVIAYSTFPGQPPAGAYFGRPGQGVSLQSDQTEVRGVQVACVNPAAIGGGPADLRAEFLAATSPPPAPAVSTGWVTYPDLYSAECRGASGATWLQVGTLAAAGRPVVSETEGPKWGYHAYDINLALGNLVQDVAAAESTYAGRHG